jgi:predicted nucleotide-binding protein
MSIPSGAKREVCPSRAIYVHFLDRELLTTLGLYEVVQEDTIFDELKILLLASYEPLYFSTSLVFENRFARAALVRYPRLFRRGHINLLMREYGFQGFVYTKQGQYEHSQQAYAFYFDETWQELSALEPAILHRSKDTTKDLECTMIADVRAGGLSKTTRRLGLTCDIKEIQRAQPHIEEAIFARDGKAITKKLFSPVYGNLDASENVRVLFNTKISEHYIRSYLVECDGTIATGIRSAIDYFSYLSTTYPFHHLPLWRTIYHKTGMLKFLRSATDRELLEIRESAEFVEFVDTVRDLIERETRAEEGAVTNLGSNLTWMRWLSCIPSATKTPRDHEEVLFLMSAATRRVKETFAVREANQASRENVIMKEKVFVVYGRDAQKRKALFDLLRAADLRPMEWEQMVALTGTGSPYIGEVLDKGLEVAQAIVVLFTGDDVAHLKEELLAQGEAAEEPTPQPRPNVILEAGMALGKNPKRTIIVQIGEMRGMSDLVGRHIIYLKDSPESRKNLLSRLATAGCSVNFSGDDWMTAGAF